MKKTNLKRRLFGTNGVRGITNQELSPEFILKLSYSIGSFFNRGKIIIAYDGRLSSPMFFNAAISGLIGTGCEVSDAGMMPTPALQYLIKEWEMDAGLMITASHNPPEYNGVKVVDKDGIEISRSKEEGGGQRMARQELYCHACNSYIQFNLNLDRDGRHEINCPRCGHVHYRYVYDGRITTQRYNSYGQTYVATSITTSMRSAVDDYYGTTSDSTTTAWF